MVRTDHGSLRWLLNFKQPEGQLARWIEILSMYEMTVEHRPGTHHRNADALSRRPCGKCKYDPDWEVNLRRGMEIEPRKSLVSVVKVKMNQSKPMMKNFLLSTCRLRTRK